MAFPGLCLTGCAITFGVGAAGACTGVGATTRGCDRPWLTALRAGPLRVPDGAEDCRAGADDCGARWCVGVLARTGDEVELAFVMARTGTSTAAATSPAMSPSAGAMPDECTEPPPLGSRSRARATDPAAKAAGAALVAESCSFIPGAPHGRNERGDSALVKRGGVVRNRSEKLRLFPAGKGPPAQSGKKEVPFRASGMTLAPHG